MREHDIDRIVKGYRTDADLEWEREQAEYNLKHGGYETELILCDEEYRHISSTLVRKRIKDGEPLSDVLPPSVEKYLKNLR
jgi:phosphopantetheine adenylyltransferase